MLETGSSVQTSTNSEKVTFSPENLKHFSVTALRDLLSPIAVAPAITPAMTSRPICIWDPYDIDAPPFPLPPSTPTKTVSRNLESH